jgi:epoxyqueuosine reductase
MDPAGLSQILYAAARQAGFDLAGIASVRQDDFDFPELEHFAEWVEKGRAGEMKYLEARDAAGRLKRASLRHAAPWARSVVVCAISYDTPDPLSTECAQPERGWISRYAWTREDYHDSVLRRLRSIESRLRDAVASADLRTWCYVDTGPIVERVYAKYAGIGWIGKNTCIIHQQLGSYTFLAIILTSLELAPDVPAADRCGTCTRCLDACPTNAFAAPYELDARRCIAYLTIEKRDAIPEELRAGVGRHVFGCDICQDVCPWNTRARQLPSRRDAARAVSLNAPVSLNEEEAPPSAARPELVNPELERLAAMSEDDFRRVFKGSPVKRTKYSGWRRNLAVAMGNSGRPEFAPRLEEWSRDPDQNLAEHARWALRQLQCSHD